MLVLGLLADTAIPALPAKRRRAYETAAKSDVKATAKKVEGFYVDGSRPLALDAGVA